jgi:hypothetical protein
MPALLHPTQVEGWITTLRRLGFEGAILITAERVVATIPPHPALVDALSPYLSKPMPGSATRRSSG